jgi:F-type H+/Na+-transporting ATPase subunit alpha
VEILKQDQYQPVPIEKQVLLIFAAGNKYLDAIPVASCRKYETDLYTFVETNYSDLLKSIREKKAIDDSVRAELTKALDAFKESFQGVLEAATV